MLELKDCGPQLSEDSISRVEAIVGQAFPPSYRSFLLQNNGGVPFPNIVEVKEVQGGETDIQVFFGVEVEEETSNILWNVSEFDVKLPGAKLLPIACDSGGAIFFLDLIGESNRVLFYDWTNEKPAIFVVSVSFENFLLSIRD